MPGLIADHVLEQIRQANDVVEVIGAYFPLKRAGANFRALCPFHKEKTPSFNVNQQRQIWHCFGCGEGGDVFKFVMKYENLDFISAVRRLAERGGVQIEIEEATGGPTRDERDLLFKLHEQVSEFFHQTLMKDKSAQVARDYLKTRRINSDTARKWRLGCSPDTWDALIQWAQAKKISGNLLETAGLVVQGERGKYDRFRGRLMFPICDEQGRVVAFSGRILTSDKEQAKYVNSPETPIFHKGKILFALDKAKRAILDAKFAIVCEGQVDTISCHEAGLENTVAPQGTALTENHARILKRYTDEVVLLFDADTAGQNAAVRGAEPLLAAGLVIRVATLPDDHDPDSFVKSEGVAKLETLIQSAPSFFQFFLDRLLKLHDPKSDRGKLQIAQQLVDWIAKIPNAVLRASCLQQAAGRLNVPESALQQELRKGRTHSRGDAAETDTPEQPTGIAAEEMLLQLMLQDERVIRSTQERLDVTGLSAEAAGRLIRLILKLHSAGQWNDPSVLLNSETDDEIARLVSKLLLQKSPAPDKVEVAAADCLAALERTAVERDWRDVKHQLAKPGLSSNEMMKLQQRVLDLRRKLDNITRLSVWKATKS